MIPPELATILHPASPSHFGSGLPQLGQLVHGSSSSLTEAKVAMVLVLCYAGGFLLASFAVRWVLGRTKILKQPPAPKKWIDDPGFWIGLCEYFLVVSFVLAREYTAIGIVFAAKGFARKDNDEEKNTYFLLGTLVNVCVALLVGHIALFGCYSIDRQSPFSFFQF